MKKLIVLFLLTILIFTVLTFSTASLQMKVDGNDMYGFPASFYVLYGGMMTPSPTVEMTSFHFLNLVLDIAVAFILAVIVLMFYQRVVTKLIKIGKK
ncbi:hypothetical protein SAMN05216297_10197 [Flavobacterium phragmitis]|uniref:Uncharacterized protein n=2 Tax=Flavobacterium phragmitis TaxID=739143 RepID=A0A1I1JSR2_9FLAO|nr:hypothetical protein SAMN05216297_10197 [Flavobacterium phragmitis]